MAITIRLAAPSDAPLLARLRRSWTEENDGGPDPDADFEHRFAGWFTAEAPHRLFWLAEHDGEPAGMLNLFVFQRMPKPGRDVGCWAYLGNVFVVAALRDHGIGRLLLDAAIAHARRERFTRLVLHPTARSVPFYERAGFVPATELLLLEL